MITIGVSSELLRIRGFLNSLGGFFFLDCSVSGRGVLGGGALGEGLTVFRDISLFLCIVSGLCAFCTADLESHPITRTYRYVGLQYQPWGDGAGSK